MGRWLFLLGGLLVWTAHFFSLYAFTSILPGLDVVRWLTIAATGVALAVDAALMGMAATRSGSNDKDPFDRWTWRFTFAGALLSFVAVLWQGIPALI